ncbi:hypothetical protein ACSLNA_25870, partial [Escherichia coli]|uniref:hypothetical protein n=1 Tax=Escherichia coli TaxID=562 RepID=UPI003EE385F1
FLSCSARRSARLRSVSSCSFRRNSSSRLSNWTLRAARPDAPHAASLKKSSPFSSGFSRIPLMQWAAPEYRSEQGKIQSLSQQ